MNVRGFALIEVLISMALLSFIACGTSQYFVWMTMKTRDNYFCSLATLNRCSSRHKVLSSNKLALLTIIWPDNKLVSV